MLSFRQKLLLICLTATPAIPCAPGDDARSTIKIATGTDLHYHGSASIQAQGFSGQTEFRSRIMIVNITKDGMEAIVAYQSGKGTARQGERSLETESTADFNKKHLQADWTTPNTGGIKGMSMMNPALGALDNIPLPWAGASLKAGESTEGGSVVTPDGQHFNIPCIWTPSVDGNEILLTCKAKSLPVADKFFKEAKLTAFSSVYRIDPAAGTVKSWQCSSTVTHEGEQPSETVWNIEMKLDKADRLKDEKTAAILADCNEMQETRMKVYQSKDLDASEKIAATLQKKFDESKSLFSDDAQKLYQLVGRMKEAKSKEAQQDARIAKLIGKPAAEILGDSLGKSLDGTEIKLSDLKGKVILLNFYASWCGPCNQEIPILNELYKSRASDGLAIIACNSQDEMDKEIAHAKKCAIAYPVILKAAGLKDKLEVTLLPTNFFIDRKGILQKRELGFDGRDALVAEIEKALAEK